MKAGLSEYSVKRHSLVLESAVVLLLCATGAALSHLWKAGPLTAQVALVALIVPAIATGLYLCISICVPELYSVGRFRPPITVSLPLIYGLALLLTMTLMSRVGLSITRMPDQLGAVNVWSNGWVLATTVIAGALCLSVLGLMAADDRAADQIDGDPPT